MFQTKKVRQGPTESATLFSKGTTKLGNDGNMWTIVVTDSGVHRWSRVKNKTVKNKTKTTLSEPVKDISQETLIKMTKKYHVTSSGSKKQLAERLWSVYIRFNNVRKRST
jgi:hypothetical protein